jgi:ClpP class serine protease
MSIGDLFWLFFIFSAIQPMLRQRMLEAMRVRKIAQLESERKSRVILLVHRQETMRLTIAGRLGHQGHRGEAGGEN